MAPRVAGLYTHGRFGGDVLEGISDDPYGMRVMSFGPSEIMVKTFDADGASYVSVYPLVRRPPK